MLTVVFLVVGGLAGLALGATAWIQGSGRLGSPLLFGGGKGRVPLAPSHARQALDLEAVVALVARHEAKQSTKLVRHPWDAL